MPDKRPPWRPAAGTAALLLLSACAGLPGLGPGSASSASAASPADPDRAVARAEQTAARRPADAVSRARLGRAYLDAGRFASAVAAFDDALELGDASSPTVIGLALAETALGNGAAALRLLEDWRDVVPASDRGLALALAGEAARGVEVLAGALRGGEGGARLRQNLALAYALDGRWREAWLMAAQDLPPDRLDRRIAEWASLASPGARQQRVAHLLGAPVRDDPGYPAALALASPAAHGQPAREARVEPGTSTTETDRPLLAGP